MRKINILTVLGAVGFFCVGGIAMAGSGKSGSIGQAPRITLKPDLVIGVAEGNDKK